MTDPTPDLRVARELAEAGVPFFLGRPDAGRPTGYALPSRWQTAAADPSVVDAWRPGWALCMVTGHGLDLIDVDPRSGGTLPLPTYRQPYELGRAHTPSGGVHLFVPSLGVESLDGRAWPGVDVKSGTPGGVGRGFAFVAPTVRASKVDGQPRAYRWRTPPRPGDLRLSRETDLYGGLLEVRERVLEMRSRSSVLEGGQRRLTRSAAAREWARATDRLVDDLRAWRRSGWGGEAHHGLLEATKHLVLLAPEHAERGFHAAFRAAGLEPDEADLAKLASALEKYSDRADVVVDDDRASDWERFEAGQGAPGPPPFVGDAPRPPPPGAFDPVDPDELDRPRRPPEPAYGAFGGSRAVFYREGVHWLQGESESGKSWVAQALAVEVLAAGGRVAYLDYEDDRRSVLERMVALGLTRELAPRLTYVDGYALGHPDVTEHLAEDPARYDLLVVDGVTSALSAAGLSGRDEQETTRWADAVPRRATCAVCVDHVVKAEDERRGMAIGTQAKKSVVTGTSIEVRCNSKFGRGTSGEIDLVLQKDKRGGVRANVDVGIRVRVHSDPNTGAVRLLVPSAATTPERVQVIEGDQAARVLALAERIERAGVEPSDKRGASTRARERLTERNSDFGGFDKSLWADAWRTFLARSGVPEARVPTYVARFLERSSNGLQDHQEDHQAVSGGSGETPFWLPDMASDLRAGEMEDHQEDHQAVQQAILQDDHQAAGGLPTATVLTSENGVPA